MCSFGGKTPVSLLHEYLVSKGQMVSYELTQNGVGTHDPEFTYRVQVGFNWEEGTGRSKQEAKHRAAERMIKKLKIVSSGNEELSDSSPEFWKSDFKENYVGLLKDFCIVHFYPEAKFYVEEEAGPPHSKIFKMICCVSQLQDFGVSTTKKLAKQQAASKMLDRLKKLVNENPNVDATDGSPVRTKIIHKIPEVSLTDEEIIEKYNALKPATGAPNKEPAVLYKDHYRAYVELKEMSPLLKSLINKTVVGHTDPLTLITEIAKELEVNVSCINVPAKDPSACDFILMTMSVLPSIAAIGTNETSAADNLLNSILTLCSY